MTFLNDVECSGLEQRLEHCNHSGIRIHDCGFQEDVGVTCGIGTWEACNRMKCIVIILYMYMFRVCH